MLEKERNLQSAVDSLLQSSDPAAENYETSYNDMLTIDPNLIVDEDDTEQTSTSEGIDQSTTSSSSASAKASENDSYSTEAPISHNLNTTLLTNIDRTPLNASPLFFRKRLMQIRQLNQMRENLIEDGLDAMDQMSELESDYPIKKTVPEAEGRNFFYAAISADSYRLPQQKENTMARNYNNNNFINTQNYAPNNMQYPQMQTAAVQNNYNRIGIKS